jgi:C2 domain
MSGASTKKPPTPKATATPPKIVSFRDDEADRVAIEILGEVVGGHNIDWKGKAMMMLLGPDPVLEPYCTIQIGSRVIHQTKKGEGGPHPIWTVATNAFFLFETTPQTIADHETLLTAALWYERKDPLQLTVLETICLGRATIPLADLFRSHEMEDRIDLPLYTIGNSNNNISPPPSKQPTAAVAAATMAKGGGTSCGILTLRFRLATLLDRHYLANLTGDRTLLLQQQLYQKKKIMSTATAPATGRPAAPTTSPSNHHMLITETNETQVAGTSFLNVVSSALRARSYYDAKTQQEMIVVKPSPDPMRVKETTYLSRSAIKTVTMAPSYEWIKAGSGNMGKVYVEVLSCHDLPNMDVAGAAGNYTDTFIAIVYEDAMVQTPVIDDELSPHWLPWTHRAFCFSMIHPTSTLYLAAFDYDLGLSQHDPIGRVAVNLTHLQQHTDYTLTYHLYPSSHVTDRTAAGTITIRVRVEYNDPKQALLTVLRQSQRPTFHVTVQKEKSLSVLRYTCYGEYGDNNEQPFDLTIVRSYVNEILEYKQAISYGIGDAVQSLLFWRGQVRIGTDLLIPLHSFLFFCMMTTLVERPYLFPSFLLLSSAWIMIAAQTQRQQHPSPVRLLWTHAKNQANKCL